jgi:hypothetical protein
MNICIVYAYMYVKYVCISYELGSGTEVCIIYIIYIHIHVSISYELGSGIDAANAKLTKLD